MDIWQQGKCNDRSGFLFNHECVHAPIGTCSVCQRPICEKHSRDGDTGPTCVDCAKKELRQAGRSQGSTRRRYGSHRRYYDDDPYFYSGYHYGGYGYYGRGYWGHRSYDSASRGDEADLTDADAAALGAEAAEGFESDMSAS
jgi:hypothetical protein